MEETTELEEMGVNCKQQENDNLQDEKELLSTVSTIYKKQPR